MIKEHGVRPVLVESPAFESLKKVMRKTGYERVVQEDVPGRSHRKDRWKFRRAGL